MTKNIKTKKANSRRLGILLSIICFLIITPIYAFYLTNSIFWAIFSLALGGIPVFFDYKKNIYLMRQENIKNP